MKKMAFFIGYSILLIFRIYAAGSADEQSQALLFKQKRVKWDNAPESAVFYECYLINEKNSNGDNVTILLDTYLKDNILLINLDSSKKIEVTNIKEMLKQDKIIYNCIVLYSNAMFGMAVVNIFEAEPINQQVGYIINGKLLDNIFDNEFDFLYLSVLRYYLGENNVLVYFPQFKRTILQLDQWPKPTKFNVLDGLGLLKNAYDNDEVFKREGKKEFDYLYIELSKLNLLRL